MADLSLQIGGSGTFQDFNDVAAAENRFLTTDLSADWLSILLPAASSNSLEGTKLTLKDILGRLPLVRDLFMHTFKQPALSEPIVLSQIDRLDWSIQAWHSEPVKTLEDACAAVACWRGRFPVLCNWRVALISNFQGQARIEFRNEECPHTPIYEQLKMVSDGNFESSLSPGKTHPPEDLLAGGALSNQGLCSPVNGFYLCQPALVYLGIFLLSSLVRYRAEMWIHAIRREASSENPADDHAISLLEKFLNFVPGIMQGTLLDYLFPNDPR